MKLLDYVAKHPDVPASLDVPWGSAILAAKSQTTAMHKIGTLAPHSTYTGKRKFIDKCKLTRVEFENGHSDILCTLPKHTRDSMCAHFLLRVTHRELTCTQPRCH